MTSINKPMTAVYWYIPRYKSEVRGIFRQVSVLFHTLRRTIICIQPNCYFLLIFLWHFKKLFSKFTFLLLLNVLWLILNLLHLNSFYFFLWSHLWNCRNCKWWSDISRKSRNILFWDIIIILFYKLVNQMYKKIWNFAHPAKGIKFNLGWKVTHFEEIDLYPTILTRKNSSYLKRQSNV